MIQFKPIAALNKMVISVLNFMRAALIFTIFSSHDICMYIFFIFVSIIFLHFISRGCWIVLNALTRKRGVCNCPIKALHSLPDKSIHPGKKIVIVKALDDVLGARRESSCTLPLLIYSRQYLVYAEVGSINIDESFSRDAWREICFGNDCWLGLFRHGVDL